MSTKIRLLTAGFAAALSAVAATTLLAASAKPVNKTIDPATWKYGPLYPSQTLPMSSSNATWGPVKLVSQHGLSWAWGTQSEYGLASYCSTALKASVAGAAPATPVVYPNPSTWTEMQHSANDHEEDWAMWAQPCAYAPVGSSFAAQSGTVASTYGYAPGTRLSTLLRRDIEKALDGGVINLNVPTVDSVEEAEDIVNTVLYPPLGHRQYRPGTQAEVMYANVPGGYRATFNDNIYIMNMIETILGSQAVNNIAALQSTIGFPDSLFGATSDLGNFSGYVSQTPTLVDYEVLIRNAYTAAKTHNDYACSAFGFDGRTETFSNPETGPVYNGGAPFVYSFNCYQN